MLKLLMAFKLVLLVYALTLGISLIVSGLITILRKSIGQ
jgi:hypothetical protein